MLKMLSKNAMQHFFKWSPPQDYLYTNMKRHFRINDFLILHQYFQIIFFRIRSVQLLTIATRIPQLLQPANIPLAFHLLFNYCEVCIWILRWCNKLTETRDELNFTPTGRKIKKIKSLLLDTTLHHLYHHIDIDRTAIETRNQVIIEGGKLEICKSEKYL